MPAFTTKSPSAPETMLSQAALPLPEVSFYSSQILIEPAVSALLQEVKEALFAAGISKELDPCPPHISLGACRTLDLQAYANENAFRAIPELSICFASFGVFRGEAGYTLFLSPQPSGELLAAQAGENSRLAASGEDLEAHYQPANFVPHLTLAYGMDAADLAKAIELASARLSLPLEARSEGLAVYGMPGARLLYREQAA